MAEYSKKVRISGKYIVETLRRQIIEHTMEPGVQLPPGRVLAQRFDVSHRTIDRAVSSLARQGLVERIPGKGTFVKHNRPTVLRPKVVVFCGSHLDGNAELRKSAFAYFNDVLLKALEKADYRPDVFEVSNYDFDHCVFPQIDFRKYDILISTIHTAAWRNALCSISPIPVIFSNDEIAHPGRFNQIYYDYLPGFLKALQSALSAGFNKFLICTSPVQTSLRRTTALQLAADELNIPRKDMEIFSADAVFENTSQRSSIACGKAAAIYILKNRMLDRMLIATSDFIAYGIVEEFSRSGLTAGQDYHLISYDNTEARNPQLQMGLTSISHPLENMAKAILQMPEDVTRNPGNGDYYRAYQVPAQELVFRESFRQYSKKLNFQTI